MIRNPPVDPPQILRMPHGGNRQILQVAMMLLADFLDGDVHTVSDVDTILRTWNGRLSGFMDLSKGVQIQTDCIGNWWLVVRIGQENNLVALGNTDTKQMHIYYGDLGSDYLNEMETDETSATIDLDVTGRRWEGGLCNGIPHGYGVLYDEDGSVEYEGFMVDNHRVCYGKEYYADIGQVKYEGFFDDTRLGKGTLYTRNGDVEYKGFWRDDKVFSPEFGGVTVDEATNTVQVRAQTCNNVRSFLVPCWIDSLKRIEIGGNCFGKVRSLRLVGLNSLESVVIGSCCFTRAKTINEVFFSIQEDGTCRIAHCPKLASIQFGDYAFSDYRSLTLEKLPSLKSIQMGESCFYYAPLFSLTGQLE